MIARPLLRENTHLTVHSKGRMETIAASHITQIRTSRRRRMCDAGALAAADATHLCHNNVAIKHSATMAQIGKFTAASVISVASSSLPSPPPPHTAMPSSLPSWIGDFAVHCYFENHCKNGLTYKPSLCRFTATKDANLLTKQQQPLQKKNEKKNSILQPRTSFLGINVLLYNSLPEYQCHIAECSSFCFVLYVSLQ